MASTDSPTTRILEVDGIRTHVQRHGGGPALLLVHGSGPGIDGPFSWDPVRPALARTFDVVVVDMPGYGQSERLPSADTPANVAAHLIHVLDELGIYEATVAGHSRGGRIASELSLAAPERVRALAILTSGSVAPRGFIMEDGDVSPTALSLVQFGADGRTEFEDFARCLRGMVHDPAVLVDDRLRSLYDDFVADGGLDDYVEKMAGFDPLLFYQDTEVDFLERLSGTRIPMSIVWGREDTVSLHQRAIELAEHLPHADLHILSGCNHFAQYDRTRDVTDLLTALAKTPAAP